MTRNESVLVVRFSACKPLVQLSHFYACVWDSMSQTMPTSIFTWCSYSFFPSHRSLGENQAISAYLVLFIDLVCVITLKRQVLTH